MKNALTKHLDNIRPDAYKALKKKNPNHWKEIALKRQADIRAKKNK